MIELRDYQEAARKAAIDELGHAEACLVVHPTGTGKSATGTAVAAEYVRRGGRVLVLAHRGELLGQWARACDEFGLSWAVEKAQERAREDALFGRADVVLGSKDTLQRRRLESWPPHSFSLIVADECHRGIAKTWLNVFSHFHPARRLGLTATPNRTDDESIQDVFGRCVHELPLWEAIEKKWLVAPLFRRPPCHVDLSKIDGRGDDLNQGDLEDEISRHVEELVNVARPYLEARPTMTFTPRVASATAMAAGFRGCGVTSCSVSGQSDDRDHVIDEFRRGGYQNLCSCDLLREGMDFPPVAALVMARPTKSGLVYRQTLGRGLRPHDGKTHCEVVDFALNSGKHDLFRPIDLFDADGMDTDILRIAGELLDRGEHADPRVALAEAERVHKQQVEMRIRAQARAPAYRLLAFDPFQVGSLLGIPNRQSGPRSRPLSAANRRRLEAHKLEPGELTNAQAAKLLGELDDRREKNLCTHRQVALLVSRGVPAEQARRLGFEAASADLDILLGDRA